MKTISIQVPDGVDEYIARTAKGRLTTKASIVREMMLVYLKENAPEALATESVPPVPATAEVAA